jgi:putative membrane protein
MRSNLGHGVFQRKNFRTILLVAYLILWLVFAIAPHDRTAWLLENLLVVLFAALLIFTSRWFAFSNESYLLMAVFLALHAAGAHYTYTHAPLGEWLKEWLHLSRNHSDRIIHFGFGLFMAYPARELLWRLARIGPMAAIWLAVAGVLAASTLFEVAEAAVAEIVSPGSGPQWLGGQGDVWDAQWDMTLALTGAIAAMLLTWSVEFVTSRQTHDRGG